MHRYHRMHGCTVPVSSRPMTGQSSLKPLVRPVHTQSYAMTHHLKITPSGPHASIVFIYSISSNTNLSTTRVDRWMVRVLQQLYHKASALSDCEALTTTWASIPVNGQYHVYMTAQTAYHWTPDGIPSLSPALAYGTTCQSMSPQHHLCSTSEND